MCSPKEDERERRERTRENKRERKKERKKINYIHTARIMTFILILDVMTTIFVAGAAVILIRMET